MKKSIIFILLPVIFLMLSACNSNSGKAFEDDPVIEPKVEFMYPSNDPENSTDDFPVNGKIIVVLNKSINYDTAEACVTIQDEENSTNDIPEIELDPACINLNNDDDNMAVFQFADKLQVGNNYKLIIEGLKDCEGKPVPKTECKFKTSNCDTIIQPTPDLLSQSSSLIQLRMIDPVTESDVLLNPFTIQDDGFKIIKDGDQSDFITCSVNYDVENMILNIIPNEKVIITEKNENYSLEISKYTNGKLTLESLAGKGLAKDDSILLDFLYKITASDGDSNDFFGRSVAVSNDGNTIVVGSCNDDIGDNEDQGSVYVYTFDGTTWNETKITASDGDSYDYFGISVAISDDGTTIVVGSCIDRVSNLRQGSAYVYTFDGTTWNETKITASDGDSYDYFGISVAISGNGTTIVVGSKKDDVGDNKDQGSVYVYTFDGTTWSETTKITANDGDSNDYFGQSVAVSGDGNTIVVGSDCDDIGSNSNQGSAYVYTFDGTTWNETKITASDGDSRDYFGTSVAISDDGTTIVVGSSDDTVGSNSYQGSAYVYTLDGGTWNETKITASDGESSDSFGISVAISNDGSTIVIGSNTDTVGLNSKQGSAYIYTLDGGTWNETKITASDGESSDSFGISVAVSDDGNTIVVGSRYDDVGSNTSQGSVYVFK